MTSPFPLVTGSKIGVYSLGDDVRAFEQSRKTQRESQRACDRLESSLFGASDGRDVWTTGLSTAKR